MIATNAESSLVTPKCAVCAADVLTVCPSCDRPIRGHYFVPGVLAFKAYEPPDFCADCDNPFPWASRQARLYTLMNMLDDEDLDPASELAVREQLEALTNGELDEGDQRRRWERSDVLGEVGRAADHWDVASRRGEAQPRASTDLSDYATASPASASPRFTLASWRAWT